jgi:hypothetical protein
MSDRADRRLGTFWTAVEQVLAEAHTHECRGCGTSVPCDDSDKNDSFNGYCDTCEGNLRREGK